MNITLNQIFWLIGCLDDTPEDDVHPERFQYFIKDIITIIDNGSYKKPDTPLASFVQNMHSLSKKGFNLLTI